MTLCGASLFSNQSRCRNEMFGFERSFLEAEYHCHPGYKLIKKFKRKSVIKNRNLVCKKRRWMGQRAVCRAVDPKAKPVTDQQQCDMHEARKCEQLCVRHENSTEATCECQKGFRLIGTRCFGKLKTFPVRFFVSNGEIIKIFVPVSFPASDINECDEAPDVCGGNGKCLNSLGSFKCSCRKGFQMNSHNRCVGESCRDFKSRESLINHKKGLGRHNPT